MINIEEMKTEELVTLKEQIDFEINVNRRYESLLEELENICQSYCKFYGLPLHDKHSVEKFYEEIDKCFRKQYVDSQSETGECKHES